MKLTEELKGKLASASSGEEAKKILREAKKDIENAGVILDDEELDQAAGGNLSAVIDYANKNGLLPFG